MIRNAKSILGAVSILAMVGVSGCSSAPTTNNAAAPRATAKTVSPVIHVLTTPKLQITSSAVLGVIGSYTNCTGQGATQWVLDTPGNAGVMEGNNPGLVAPTIELDDSACVLSITTISSSTDGYTVDKSSSLPFTGPGVSAQAYLATAAAFDDSNKGGVLGFYANAQSNVTDGTANFSVTLLLGDDPNVGSGSTTASVQTVSGSLGVNDVLAPDYGTDTSGVTLFDDVNGVASTVSGTITLNFSSQAGENYIVFHGQDLSTDDFASLDGAWNSAVSSEATVNAIPSGNGNVSVDPTTLVTAGNANTGDQLPITSTILVQHVDASGNIPVYEVIAITFNSHFGGG